MCETGTAKPPNKPAYQKECMQDARAFRVVHVATLPPADRPVGAVVQPVPAGP